MAKNKLSWNFSSSCLGVSVSLWLVLALTAASPVRGASVVVRQADGFDPGTVKRAAFLPLVAALPVDDDGVQAVCPFDRLTHDAGVIGEAGEAEVSRAVGQALEDNPGLVSWISPGEINAARARVEAGGGEVLSPGGPLQLAVGRELHADAVLFGFIYCYRDRSGNAYASSHPARIGFCLHLADPATGQDLWSFTYEDEQKALSDNLLEAPAFVKRKGRWITAEEMARESAGEVVKRLPGISSPPNRRKQALKRP